MSDNYISVKEAIKRTGQSRFLRNVKVKVIPRLIEKGLLNGKREKRQLLVADDEILTRTLQLGIEPFVQDTQGYSFAMFHAPIEQVATTLQERPSVVELEENVTPHDMHDNVEMHADEKLRHVFLLQMQNYPHWTVLIQTVHWFQSCDAVMVTALASALSEQLQTRAAAVWDDDFSGSSLIVCDKGKLVESFGDEGEDDDDWVSFYEFFYEQGISLPNAFISTGNELSTLHVADPTKVQRTDRVVVKVPDAIESKHPHAVEKLAMMAQAVIEEIDDEEAFIQGIRGGIWQQAQHILSSGKF